MRSSTIALERIWACDFETTGTVNLEVDGHVRVWLWCAVCCGTGERLSGTNIDSFIAFLHFGRVKMCVFHNLRFDGSFLLSRLLQIGEVPEMIIDGRSHIWYAMNIFGVQIRDSLKKAPFKLEQVAEKLGIPGKTESPDFTRYLPEGYSPTLDEIAYCFRDCEIVAELMRREHAQGRMRLTASSEAYLALRRSIPAFDRLYPELALCEDAFVRRAYNGGISYLNDVFRGLDVKYVWTYDINSSYPYQMHDRPLPVSYGWWTEPERDQLYVVHFTAEFHLKAYHIPSILATHYLRWNNGDNQFVTETDGPMELTMTSVDYELFHRQYDVDYEIDHSFISYDCEVGNFAPFVDMNMNEKVAAKQRGDLAGSLSAKLNMNMSYGSFGVNPRSFGAVPYLDETGRIAYELHEQSRAGRHIPTAAFITAWGRKTLIDAAQAQEDRHHDTVIYTDTDSIHLTRPAVGLDEDSYRLGAWKREIWHEDGEEVPFAYARYLRPKCYIHCDSHKQVCVEYDKYGRVADLGIRAAGVPEAAKEILTWDNFRSGHLIEGKLAQCSVPGGVCLMPTTYTL